MEYPDRHRVGLLPQVGWVTTKLKVLSVDVLVADKYLVGELHLGLCRRRKRL